MYIANLTTRQFIEYTSQEELNFYLKEVITKCNKYTAIIKQDIGNSIWKRDDKIVFVPSYLETYVQKEYGKIYL